MSNAKSYCAQQGWTSTLVAGYATAGLLVDLPPAALAMTAWSTAFAIDRAK
jgi:hypothetical protein